MLRFFAILFGIAFIFGGVAGFLPTFVDGNLLFGYFQVNTMHNIIHIASGVIAIMASTSIRYTRLYFQIFGVVYALTAIAGFWTGGDLMMMQVNLADNILHTVIGVVSMYLGFFVKHKQA